MMEAPQPFPPPLDPEPLSPGSKPNEKENIPPPASPPLASNSLPLGTTSLTSAAGHTQSPRTLSGSHPFPIDSLPFSDNGNMPTIKAAASLRRSLSATDATSVSANGSPLKYIFRTSGARFIEDNSGKDAFKSPSLRRNSYTLDVPSPQLLAANMPDVGGGRQCVVQDSGSENDGKSNDLLKDGNQLVSKWRKILQESYDLSEAQLHTDAETGTAGLRDANRILPKQSIDSPVKRSSTTRSINSSGSGGGDGRRSTWTKTGSETFEIENKGSDEIGRLPIKPSPKVRGGGSGHVVKNLSNQFMDDANLSPPHKSGGTVSAADVFLAELNEAINDDDMGRGVVKDGAIHEMKKDVTSAVANFALARDDLMRKQERQLQDLLEAHNVQRKVLQNQLNDTLTNTSTKSSPNRSPPIRHQQPQQQQFISGGRVGPGSPTRAHHHPNHSPSPSHTYDNLSPGSHTQSSVKSPSTPHHPSPAQISSAFNKLSSFPAYCRGFLIRSLLRTKKVKQISQTIQETSSLVNRMNSEIASGSLEPTKSDFDLLDRAAMQLEGGRADIFEILYLWPLDKKVELLVRQRSITAAVTSSTAGATSGARMNIPTSASYTVVPAVKKVSSATMRAIERRRQTQQQQQQFSSSAKSTGSTAGAKCGRRGYRHHHPPQSQRSKLHLNTATTTTRSTTGSVPSGRDRGSVNSKHSKSAVVTADPSSHAFSSSSNRTSSRSKYPLKPKRITATGSVTGRIHKISSVESSRSPPPKKVQLNRKALGL